MEIMTREQDKVTILTISGEIEIYNAGHLKAALQQMLDKGQNRLVLNMEEIPFIDSTGIGALLLMVPLIRKAGGDIKLAAVSENVLKVFQITQLSKFFQIYDNDTEAVKAFR